MSIILAYFRVSLQKFAATESPVHRSHSTSLLYIQRSRFHVFKNPYGSELLVGWQVLILSTGLVRITSPLTKNPLPLLSF